MVWQPEIDQLSYLRHLAQQMGGKEGVARQQARGKLTVRERIESLADPGSFQEIGDVVGSTSYDGDKLVAFMPVPLVIGFCTLNGRKVVISGGDFTVRGAALDRLSGIGSKAAYAQKLALEQRLPFIRLLDSAGGSVRSVENIGRTYLPDLDDNPGWFPAVRLLSIAPVVSAVLGSVAGGPAVEACTAHFNVMVKGISQVFCGGPPVVKAALGYDITKETLGDEHVQAYQSGVIDNVAENEEAAFSTIRRFLSYLPNNVWEMPPRVEPKDDPKRRDEELLSIIPRERNKTYDPYAILNHVLDHDSIFEIAPFYGRSRITALARVDGYPVGVMINNPRHLGGSTDVAGGEKVMRFLELCDTFHLPMVHFVDEPGFMVGLESEKQGIVRAGARLTCVTCQTKMPWITFAVRQVYGVAGMLNTRTDGMYQRYAWPSAHWGSLHIEGGVAAAYRREIEAAPDPESKREEIELRFKTLASPLRTAAAFGIEHLIDPQDTRPILCDFIEDTQAVLRTQLGPTAVPYLP